VAKDPRDLPSDPTPAENGIVSIDLEIKELLAEVFVDGDDPDDLKNTLVWTFGGTVPGQMIRVKEGATVEFVVTNATNNYFTHGITVPAASGTEVTLDESNGRKTFTFNKAGAYIYQGTTSGFQPWVNRAYGLYGLIVVEPTGGFPDVDHEFYIAVSEWYLKEAEPEENPHHTEETLVLDSDREEVSLWTLNGHQFALKDSEPLFGESIRSEQGEKVRFYFLNGGSHVESNWHIIGTIFSQVIQDFENPVRNEETVLIPPGEAAIFELDTPVPGTFLIVDHALFRAPQGHFGFLNVDPKGDYPTDIYSPEP
jgi:nitrite reductase (NO-forming)